MMQKSLGFFKDEETVELLVNAPTARGVDYAILSIQFVY
jgi:hypothetical protein